jgi:branched-subunit amino acid aminotransferase/4-amino-4-deoxychorismate lyase
VRGGLPGIVRAALLADLAVRPLEVGSAGASSPAELDLEENDLARAEEVLLTNSVQRVVGLAELQSPAGLSRDLPGAQGPFARALGERLAALESAAGPSGSPRPGPC